MKLRHCPYCLKKQNTRQEQQIHGTIITIENYCIVCLHTWWTDGLGRTIGGPMHSNQTHPYREWRTY